MVVRIAQQRKCTYCHWIVHLKTVEMVNFVMYILLQKKFNSTNHALKLVHFLLRKVCLYKNNLNTNLKEINTEVGKICCMCIRILIWFFKCIRSQKKDWKESGGKKKSRKRKTRKKSRKRNLVILSGSCPCWAERTFNMEKVCILGKRCSCTNQHLQGMGWEHTRARIWSTPKPTSVTQCCLNIVGSTGHPGGGLRTGSTLV